MTKSLKVALTVGGTLEIVGRGGETRLTLTVVEDSYDTVLQVRSKSGGYFTAQGGIDILYDAPEEGLSDG